MPGPAAGAACFRLLATPTATLAPPMFEAMAAGVVPVASDVGGQRELVTPECGVLVAHGPDEIERYVEALRQLAAR